MTLIDRCSDINDRLQTCDLRHGQLGRYIFIIEDDIHFEFTLFLLQVSVHVFCTEWRIPSAN